MVSTRSLHTDITNALDFLQDAELVVYATSVAMRHSRVTWHEMGQGGFDLERGHSTVRQYLDWVAAGHYSALLPDAALLQLTYEVIGSEVVAHRLAYVPCPVIIDEELLRLGEPVADVVEVTLASDPNAVALRSPVRFDFDPGSAAPGHPAAHFTINGDDCRIACVAAMHPYRFIDFVYRHFYPTLWRAQSTWFGAAVGRRLGERVITDADRMHPHMVWHVD